MDDENATVSQTDEPVEIISENIMEDAVDNESTETPVEQTASFDVKSQKNYLKDSDFDVGLLDENKTPLVNKTVNIKVDGKSFSEVTDSNGIARISLNFEPGDYTVSYSFNESGYKTISASKKIFIIPSSTSKAKISYNSAVYAGIKNTYTVTLTVGGIALSNRVVTFTVNGKTYNKKTDEDGKASLTVKLPAGTKTLKYSYAGEENIKKTSGSVKLKVQNGMPVTVKKANSVIYRHKTSAPFKIKLVDAYGNPLVGKKVKFTINKKSYTKTTDSKGIATINLKMSKGTYTMKVTRAKTTLYKKISKSYTVKIKPKQARNNGLWLLSTDMAKVDFEKLKSVGTKHIFLNAKAIERYGQKYVESFIENATDSGIKTHLWVQVFYENGKWINPIKKGKINYDLIKSKITQVKKFAKVKGISGIHFDYLRFPGTAYKYKYGVKAVNYFTKYATKAVHAVNSKYIVSAAVMPEPSSMKYYYGQDISTMSKYLDVIVPMVYKGNYNAGTKWIQSVTKAFVKKSNGAKIWTGLQTYKSDSDVTKLSASALMNDADAAAMGGAYGVILFRFGLLNYINFNNV